MCNKRVLSKPLGLGLNTVKKSPCLACENYSFVCAHAGILGSRERGAQTTKLPRPLSPPSAATPQHTVFDPGKGRDCTQEGTSQTPPKQSPLSHFYLSQFFFRHRQGPLHHRKRVFCQPKQLFSLCTLVKNCLLPAPAR